MVLLKGFYHTIPLMRSPEDFLFTMQCSHTAPTAPLLPLPKPISKSLSKSPRTSRLFLRIFLWFKHSIAKFISVAKLEKTDLGYLTGNENQYSNRLRVNFFRFLPPNPSVEQSYLHQYLSGA